MTWQMSGPGRGLTWWLGLSPWTQGSRSVNGFVDISGNLWLFILETWGLRVERGCSQKDFVSLSPVRVCLEHLAEPSIREVFNSLIQENFKEESDEAKYIESKWTMFSISVSNPQTWWWTPSTECHQAEEGILLSLTDLRNCWSSWHVVAIYTICELDSCEDKNLILG